MRGPRHVELGFERLRLLRAVREHDGAIVLEPDAPRLWRFDPELGSLATVRLDDVPEPKNEEDDVSMRMESRERLAALEDLLRHRLSKREYLFFALHRIDGCDSSGGGAQLSDVGRF